MSIYNRLRLDIKHENLEIKVKEEEKQIQQRENRLIRFLPGSRDLAHELGPHRVPPVSQEVLESEPGKALPAYGNSWAHIDSL